MEELNENTTVELNVPATYQSLNVLGSVVRAMLERVTGLAERERFAYGVELAVHETCTNIVEHAYELKPGRIRAKITLQQEPQQLIIDLFDNGKSFNPADVVPPKLDRVQTSGYGLFLVQQLMDEVAYEPGGQDNHWRLVKYIELEQGSQNGDYSRSG